MNSDEENLRDELAELWRDHQFDAVSRCCSCGVMEHPDWAGEHFATSALAILARDGGEVI